jgi:FkbM family methyltransferase
MSQNNFRELINSIRQQKEILSLEEKQQIINELHEIHKLDYSDGEIFLHTDSTVERELRSISCRKEPMTVAWLKQELRPGDVLYDIGANVGAYSLIASHLSQGKATVYAFEPSFQNFGQLCRNIILNNCQSSIIPLQISLCQKTCLDRFYYQNLELGGSLHSFSRNIDYKSEVFEPVASLGMLGFSLNDLVKIPGVLLPNLLKVDVDGLEYDILLGASNLLQDSQLRSILIEINEDLSEETKNIISFLFDQGLVPLEKHKLHRNLHNYIFVRNLGQDKEPIHASGVKLASSRGNNW